MVFAEYDLSRGEFHATLYSIAIKSAIKEVWLQDPVKITRYS